MIDGINALVQAFGSMWQAIFNAPFYGALTWGYLLVAILIMDIFITFFMSKIK